MAVGCGPSSNQSPLNLSKSLERAYEKAVLSCELDLSGRKFKEYPQPPSNYDLSDTIRADISNNRLGELPKEICKYTLLERLYINNNIIKGFTESLLSLQQLTHLYIGLASLKVLDVSGNRLSSLPDDLSMLQNLTLLNASQNQIDRLPPSLGDLDELRSLNVRRNQLQTIPIELCFLKLISLDLSFNQLCALPSEFQLMSSLVTLSLEANPLSKPPAQTVRRGKAHIFKWLENNTAKEDRKRNSLEVEFRKIKKHMSISSGSSDFSSSVFESSVAKRSTLDSGYSTSENGDKRWLSDSLHFEYNSQSRPSDDGYCGEAFSATASTASTPSTLSPGTSFNLEDEFHRAMKIRNDSADNNLSNDDANLRQQLVDVRGVCDVANKRIFRPTHIPQSSSSQPQMNDCDRISPYLQSDQCPNVPIPTYREYLEAKRQQRALVSSTIYKRNNEGETSNAANAYLNSEGLTKEDVKSVQKKAVLSYVKQRVSPTKTLPDAPSKPINGAQAINHDANGSSVLSTGRESLKAPTNGACIRPRAPKTLPLKTTATKSSPVHSAKFKAKSPTKPMRSAGFTAVQKSKSMKTPPDHDPSKSSFTYRREIDKQQHEKQLIDNMRTIIESRLKVSLPADIGAALMDGVVLCHLVNHIRPRAVSSIHVPSPATPKLTIAKCRLNVENFLDACRRIGVEEEYVCSAADVLEERGVVRTSITVERLLSFYKGKRPSVGELRKTGIPMT